MSVAGSRHGQYDGGMTGPAFSVHPEDEPSWADVIRHAEHGEQVAVIAHGRHVADVVPSGELDRLHETIAVLSDSELMHDLSEGLAEIRAGHVFSAEQIAADLAARREESE
jgi:antitoxin (DNA-binding transcriptional repressor) of toxin-antitoxin stability system